MRTILGNTLLGPLMRTEGLVREKMSLVMGIKF